jgi:hypothetical protein
MQLKKASLNKLRISQLLLCHHLSKKMRCYKIYDVASHIKAGTLIEGV